MCRLRNLRPNTRRLRVLLREEKNRSNASVRRAEPREAEIAIDVPSLLSGVTAHEEGPISFTKADKLLIKNDCNVYT